MSPTEIKVPTKRTKKYASLKSYDVSTSCTNDRIAKQTSEGCDVFHYVKLTELPDYAELKKEVESEIARMSWWESYGIDNAIHLFGVVAAVVSFYLMRVDSPVVFCFAIFLLGFCHSILSIKGGHLAAHKAAVQSAPLNRAMAFFFSDMCGTFPSDAAYSMHIKEHHGYTNIMGIGDSSTWRVPVVPAYLYMFVMPLLVPVLTPLVSLASLWGQWFRLGRFLCFASLGLFFNFYLFTQVAGFTFWQSLCLTLVSRGVLSIPYIHVNVFQHIGLPMYTLKDKPKKIYQMSTGVLNLARNPLLDYCFGHSIISAHIEHHLFPKLSDQQCLRVRPIVRHFLTSRGMAYNEADYGERVGVFLTKYRDLMQLAPPISHFVGLQ